MHATAAPAPAQPCFRSLHDSVACRVSIANDSPACVKLQWHDYEGAHASSRSTAQAYCVCRRACLLIAAVQSLLCWHWPAPRVASYALSHAQSARLYTMGLGGDMRPHAGVATEPGMVIQPGGRTKLLTFEVRCGWPVPAGLPLPSLGVH